jgi:hypothetical protein
MKNKTILIALALALNIFSFTAVRAATPEETGAIAKDAYFYAFAMLENYNTWYPQAVVKDSPACVGHESPGVDKESNWLPALNDTIYLVMRLYWPKTEDPSILPPGDGTWKPPGIVQAD